MPFRFPYVSLDIETTGLDRSASQVLQLSAVYDNGREIEELPTFDRVIKWPVIFHGEEYAMNLNRHLIKRSFMNDRVVSIEIARRDFDEWLESVQPSGKLTAAGKNIQGFDLPILENALNGFRLTRFLRRVLDPGSMYSDEFDHVPNLNEINHLTGRKPVSHNALDDCLDVVYAIRRKWL